MNPNFDFGFTLCSFPWFHFFKTSFCYDLKQWFLQRFRWDPAPVDEELAEILGNLAGQAFAL
jgi:hypothetical protein